MNNDTEMDRLLEKIDHYKLVTVLEDKDHDNGEEFTLEGTRFARDGAGGFQIESDFYAGSKDSDDKLLKLQSVLDFYRRAKQRRYRSHIRNGYSGLKCVAEGDSWCELPPLGYASDIVLELWKEYAVLSLAKAGDAWSNLLRQDELFSTISAEKSDVVLLSVGGNNVLGSIEKYVHQWSPNRPVDDYVNDDFEYLLNLVYYYTDLWASKIVGMDCEIIMHGYGYCDPRPAGKGGWIIGGPLSQKRNINDQTIWRAVVKEMVDRFNNRILNLAAQPKFNGKFRFIDLRKVIGTGSDWWQDEIHPTKKGFEHIAVKFRQELKEIEASRFAA
ncbi:SGNH/GDSL hydrolase family protein [Roseibium sp. MB-4]